jgi:hypothetical protein
METLNTFRIPLIDGIIQGLSYYFPAQDYKAIEILNPTEIPVNSSDFYFYGVSEFSKICELFGFKDQKVSVTESFQHLLTKIVEKNSFVTDRCGLFKGFWSLQLSDQSLPWVQQTKHIIRSILSLPISSTECERGFSVMKFIKDEKRSNLKPETLEAILRCKTNGPRDERYFNADYYARAWLKDNHMRSDDPAKQRKKLKTSDSRSEKINTDLAEIEPTLEEDYDL